MNTAYIFELCHTQLLLQFCLHSCSVCKSLLPTDYCKFDKPVYMCMLPPLYSVIYTDCHQQDLFLNLSSSSEIWIMQQGTPSLAKVSGCAVLCRWWLLMLGVIFLLSVACRLLLVGMTASLWRQHQTNWFVRSAFMWLKFHTKWLAVGGSTAMPAWMNTRGTLSIVQTVGKEDRTSLTPEVSGFLMCKWTCYILLILFH